MSAPNLVYLTSPYVAGSGVLVTNPLGPIVAAFDCVPNQVTVSAPNSPTSTTYAISGSPGGNRVSIGGVVSGIDQNYPIGSTLSFLLVPSSSGLTLTTTGTSGASTLVGSTLNVPQYSGGGGSGTVNAGTTGLPAVYSGSTAVSSTSTPVIPTSVVSWASTTNLDASLSNRLQVTLAGATTLTVSNFKVDQFVTLVLIQDGTGSRTISGSPWFSGLTWAGGSAPTLQTAAGAVDTVAIWCRSSGVYEGYNAIPAAGGGSGTVTTTGSPTTGQMTKFSGSTSIVNAVSGTDYQGPLSLTVVGSSGASTLIGNTLNIPTYTGGGGGGGTGLAATATKTANFTFAAGNYCPVDTTSGAVTGTLLTAPADGTVVAAEMTVQGSTNALTIAAGGSDVINLAGVTSLVLPYVNQMVWLQYQASTSIWWTVAANNATKNAGDYVSSTVASSTTSLVINTYAAPTSISLVAGTWDVTGVAAFAYTSASVVNLFGNPSTSATGLAGTTDLQPSVGTNLTSFTGGYNLQLGTVRFVLAATTTIFLTLRSNFTGTATAGGTIRATRIR